MPIVNLQRTMRQLGRIRMGSQVAASNGKMRPAKLETWRLTSKYRDYLENAAELYGGTVQEWAGAPDGGQWELFTESDSLEVIIPPGEMAFSQWYELWTGGGCIRRCDSEIEQLTGDPCICPHDPEQRVALAAKGQACKPTTRLSVIQPQLPDIGLWRLETHGWYGAIELAGSIEVLRAAQSVSGLIPARLRIDQRSAKREGSTINYAVPVIELATLTARTLMTGEVPTSAISAARSELHAPQAALPEAAAAAPASPSTHSRSNGQSKASGGDNAAFLRAVNAAAKRAGVDADRLSAIAFEAIGKPLGEIASGEETNKVLAALKNLPQPVPVGDEAPF